MTTKITPRPATLIVTNPRGILALGTYEVVALEAARSGERVVLVPGRRMPVIVKEATLTYAD